jgi:hypothetical protein
MISLHTVPLPHLTLERDRTIFAVRTMEGCRTQRSSHHRFSRPEPRNDKLLTRATPTLRFATFRHRDNWGFVTGITLLGVFLSASAQAATFTVNNPLDVVDAAPGNGICETAPGDGVCTLRAAIQETNALAGADEIILPPNTYLLTIVSELGITGSVTITGGGASTTIIDGNKSVRPNSRVLVAGSGITVNISGVTIRNGETGGGGEASSTSAQ